MVSEEIWRLTLFIVFKLKLIHWNSEIDNFIDDVSQAGSFLNQRAMCDILSLLIMLSFYIIVNSNKVIQTQLVEYTLR